MSAPVDELIEQIRLEADAHRARQDRDAPRPNARGVAELDRLRAHLTIARRAQDRLPPVTSYRRGRLAKIELWIKRSLKRATHWFTWEQTNFNAATSESFNTTLAILARLEQNIAALRDQVDANSPNGGNAEILRRLAEIEKRLQTVTHARESGPLDLLRDEQRVCFKQLGRQVEEAAVISERTKRNFQMQLDALSRRLEAFEKTNAENRSD
jgi:hypothetical protein